jgi:hypothetical protein
MGVAQERKHLPSKHKALNSNTSTGKRERDENCGLWWDKKMRHYEIKK